MAYVEIYTKDYCPYCDKAKLLLDQLNVDYVEHDLVADPEKFDELQLRRPNARTVPQIFINDLGIGGCDDLYALHDAGKLKPMLEEVERPLEGEHEPL
ncbi:MAG: glutaredoxin 3 [Alphaproteobacteria bacterium]|nr:MAG: glutaredoxin 3 [Alphaproteobacteria bacterium]